MIRDPARLGKKLSKKSCFFSGVQKSTNDETSKRPQISGRDIHLGRAYLKWKSGSCSFFFVFTFLLQTQKVRDFPKRELLGVKSPGFAKKRALSKKSPGFEK